MEQQHDPKRSLNQRMESVGWALFLIMIGSLWLVPKGTVPESAWLFGAGVILIGLNLVRLAVGIKASRFTLAVGILSVALGLCDVYGVKVPVIPILAILGGAAIILKPLLAKKQTPEPQNRADGEDATAQL